MPKLEIIDPGQTPQTAHAQWRSKAHRKSLWSPWAFSSMVIRFRMTAAHVAEAMQYRTLDRQ
jgi:hypothetical protein